MLSTLFGLITVAETVLLGMVIALRRRRPDWALTLLILVLLGLIWDNAVIAMGATIGEGDTLEALSFPRYAAHGILVPLLIMVGVGLARRHDVRFFTGATVPAVLGTVTALLITIGIWLDIVTLDLEPTRYADTLRYTNAAAHGPPIPAVATILILIAIGALLLARARQPWLLAGSIAMFAAAGAAVAGFWIGNVGELILILTIWRTATHESALRTLPGSFSRS
ncbi:hypothetical protein Aca07nite_31400 [Actinoplanes capillaceus]|uniref:PAP2 superfamily protein n=1 Tax=Actinoplanes campanulatus TaxID=113559 RepID=A0ABQ3WI12_9ACTN|nr:hypothetical protein [Actinoplanes capillaceus]GID45865.1 hypothetical protein Aca07nite_31400 [Actinoplanes capillaceus]